MWEFSTEKNQIRHQFYFFKDFHLFIFRKRRREGEREKHQCVFASHAPLLGTWPATEARALTGNLTHNLLVPRLALSPLRHTSQGLEIIFNSKL